LITFIQIVADAMNATVMIPGEYKSFGHDYRADTLDFVSAVYDLPPITPAQAIAIHETLVRRELDRGARTKAEEPGEVAPPSEMAKGSLQ
jgi:hypothetical protein